MNVAEAIYWWLISDEILRAVKKCILKFIIMTRNLLLYLFVAIYNLLIITIKNIR